MWGLDRLNNSMSRSPSRERVEAAAAGELMTTTTICIVEEKFYVIPDAGDEPEPFLDLR